MYKIGENRKSTEWLQTELYSQKYSIYIKYLAMRPKFWSVSLYGYPFPKYSMYKVTKNRKYTERPQTELELLTVKSTLYTPNTYLSGPNFSPFRCTTSGSQDVTPHCHVKQRPPPQKKKEQNCQKSKFWNFTICLYNFGRDHS